MNLEQYLYEYMRDGGRNPSLLKKFIKYLEDNIVEVNDYPLVVDDFLECFAFTSSTKRTYRTSCINFVRYVYRRLGLFLPWEQPKIEDEYVVQKEVKENIERSAQQELAMKSIQNEHMNQEQNSIDTKIRATKELKLPSSDTKSVVDDEEYNAFLEKYERLCK